MGAACGGKKRRGNLGTPPTPAKGCRPLHSCLLHLARESGDTPDPGKGLPPSALLLVAPGKGIWGHLRPRQRAAALCTPVCYTWHRNFDRVLVAQGFAGQLDE